MTTTTDRISASGRVIRVAPKYVYIHSDQYGTIFAYPAAYFNALPDPPPTNNLTEVLRIDDVVHFVAVPQQGQNGCAWIAVKITKRQSIAAKDDAGKAEQTRNGALPEVIRNIPGTIIELHDRNGFIYSNRYGKIYFPMAAASIAHESNELHPLNALYVAGEYVLFDAQRQPIKNDCRYAATRVQNLPPDYSWEQEAAAEASPAKKPKENGAASTTKPPECDGPELVYEEGEIARLFFQYGFIRSEKLGTVYFTLAHVECETFASNLLELMALGDRVRFVPMPQPEKNGCRWRGLKVRKLDPDLISPLVQMLDDQCSVGEGESDRVIVCEVSTQTDQSLWNTFLVSQTAGPSRRRERMLPVQDAACQTRTPPEALLLKAVKEDGELEAVLRERFPHLMKLIDKTT